MNAESANENSVLLRIRRLLTAVYAFGAAGMVLELVLMEHTEDIWQWIPVVLIGLSLLLVIGKLWMKRRWMLRGLQLNLVLILVAAVVGMWLHFDGKAEFQLEMDPELKGWDLIWKCIHGHSLPPVLAPGAMILLGLVGLVGLHRHPLLGKSKPVN